jgi:PAS domain-containing protein
MSHTNDRPHAALLPCFMGFFSWDLSTDKVYGDAALADLFDIDPAVQASGCPILPMIERIAADDKPLVAESIHRAITTGGLYQERYRLVHPRRGVIEVFSTGRCLKDAEGVPSIFNGAVVNVATGVIPLGTDALELHCRSALDIAQRRGNELAARYLSSALRAIGSVESATEGA